MSSLQTIGIRVSGDLGGALEADVLAVMESTRNTALRGEALPTDNVPNGLSVVFDDGFKTPMVAAVMMPDGSALIHLKVTGRLWSRLAYQFGHELGHVLCNSWGPEAIPKAPCQWLEEALVEAFSLATLRKMAKRWRRDAPYENWREYAEHIGSYASGELAKYANAQRNVRVETEGAKWFVANRAALEKLKALGPELSAAVVWFARVFETMHGTIPDLAALNRWERRSALPLDRYLTEWQAACDRIGSRGVLPTMIRSALEIR